MAEKSFMMPILRDRRYTGVIIAWQLCKTMLPIGNLTQKLPEICLAVRTGGGSYDFAEVLGRLIVTTVP
jgi:hypothetical protein